MLIYHFGSREGLLEAVVLEQVERAREDDAELFPYDGVGDLDRRWEQGKTPEERNFDRLFFELAAYAASHSDETSRFRSEYVEPWLKMSETAAREAGIDSSEARALSRLDVAVLVGLALDRQLTDDDDEIDRAFERYAEMRRPIIEQYRTRRDDRLGSD